MTTAENKQSGMYWHCHHDVLCEYVWDYQERVDYIKTEKPKNEIKTRLRLFKKVKGKLPKEFDKAREKYDETWKKCDEAWEKHVEARKKYDKAWVNYDEVRKMFVEVRKMFVEARKKYAPQLELLHKKECGCKEWNGKEIVFK